MERSGVDEVPPGAPASVERAGDEEPEVSVVMPCLNESQTIGRCVEATLSVLRAHGLTGEVIVCDNGSTDGSGEIARGAGARVVAEPRRGYGNAYLRGLEAARGRYLVMADSDGTYDLGDLPRFLSPLRAGHDVVIGNRFAGRIVAGAMPWHHRYIGNPLLSGVLNLFFRTGIGDAHCGMRALTREAYRRMRLETSGMEFASEMVINAAKAGLRMTEVPITYYPRAGRSKIRSFRDGWRHLRFMLLLSPTHLYLWPGAALMALGFSALLALAFGPVRIEGLTFGFHWMFVSSLLGILGFQLLNLGLVARVYSLTSHLDKAPDPVVAFFTQRFRMEVGIALGAALFGAGLSVYLFLLAAWLRGGLNLAESFRSVRLSVLALTLCVLGAQTVFSSFFISAMAIKRGGQPR